MTIEKINYLHNLYIKCCFIFTFIITCIFKYFGIFLEEIVLENKLRYNVLKLNRWKDFVPRLLPQNCFKLPMPQPPLFSRALQAPSVISRQSSIKRNFKALLYRHILESCL